MKRLFDSLAEWADWIIVDAPPLLSVADTSAVARWADGVLMVTSAGYTTREMAKASRETLAGAGSRLIGIVMWGLNKRSSARAGYRSYYAPGQD